MLKTCSGSCHCGTVRFAADVDVAAGSVKCNCSICWKLRLWSVRIRPDAFRLLAGASDLTDYRGANPVAHHLFCRHCGVHPFERIDPPNMTGGVYYNVNVACLEGLDPADLIAAPVTYCDGANDHWGATPVEVRHL